MKAKLWFCSIISVFILVALMLVQYFFYVTVVQTGLLKFYVYHFLNNENGYWLLNSFYGIFFLGFQPISIYFHISVIFMLYLFWLLESWFEYTYIANNLSKVPVIDWNEHFSVKPENQNPQLKKIIWFGNLIFYVAAALYLNFYCFSFMKL